ncbi:unannotated protein [freshwater metagenome]|uniref:Unannotated protein n=1 Tax=freshwater metagenome TaxID=449393 RepID=A0A6J6JHP2_9ZZZZ
MLAINIGICHQHNLVIADLLNIEVFPDTSAKGSNHSLNLSISKSTIQSGFLNVQNLAAQGQNRLGLGVTARHCATAGRVALHQKNLADRSVLRLAILQFSWHTAGFEQPFTSSLFARLAGGNSCL